MTCLQELSCVVADNRAVAHLLAHNMTYQKPEFLRFELSYLLGEGETTFLHPYSVDL